MFNQLTIVKQSHGSKAIVCEENIRRSTGNLSFFSKPTLYLGEMSLYTLGRLNSYLEKKYMEIISRTYIYVAILFEERVCCYLCSWYM